MIHNRKFFIESEIRKKNYILSFKVMHQWERHPIQRILKSENDLLYEFFVMNMKYPWLFDVIMVLLSVWIILGSQCLQNGEVDEKEKNTAGSVIAIIIISIIIWPVIAYLEMQFSSFLFKKIKSRMTIDDENDQYRPLQ